MQRTHRTYSAHTTHTDHSQDLSEGEEWFQVGPKGKIESRQLPPLPNRDSRVLVSELVMVSDLMPELMSEEIASRDVYFGKYGKIAKTILTTKLDSDSREVSNQAFITYQNELDASLAIAALMDYSHKKYKILPSSGTCKFCSAFLKGIPCKIQDCYFIHERRWQTIDIKLFQRMNKRDKLRPVLQKINENLEYFIRKEHMEFIESKQIKLNRSVYCCCEGNERRQKIVFPSIKDTMTALGERGLIEWGKYQQMKLQYKLQIRQQEAQKKKIQNDMKNYKIHESPKREPEIKEEEVIEQIKNRERQTPEISKRDLLSETFEKQTLTRTCNLSSQEERGEKEKGLSVYLQLMGPSGLSSYIHHKLVQEVNWTNPPLKSLFDFARKPCSAPPTPEHLKFKKIVLSTLTSV